MPDSLYKLQSAAGPAGEHPFLLGGWPCGSHARASKVMHAQEELPQWPSPAEPHAFGTFILPQESLIQSSVSRPLLDRKSVV